MEFKVTCPQVLLSELHLNDQLHRSTPSLRTTRSNLVIIIIFPLHERFVLAGLTDTRDLIFLL